jgi:oxygen-independent coproporphyrinogen-3 oxidase
VSGLYVHLPFCSIKCAYCGFAAFSGQGRYVPRYLKALEREAAFFPRFAPRTLYLGGGTPTELKCEELSELLASLSRRYGDLHGLVEVSVEANPESLGEDKLDLFRAAGVSRVSLGLQASQERLLKFMGRRHRWEDFLAAFRGGKERGFSMNTDLMLGMPGQSVADATETLDRVLDLEPHHLSLYSLYVEEKTLFCKRGVAVDEDLARDMLCACMDRLTRAGYLHYEISNFARPGHESLHNLNYWEDGRYLGLGCGASGHLDGERYQNEERLARYLERLEAGERPVAFSEILTGRRKLGETVMLGLRKTAGMAVTPEMEREFGLTFHNLAALGLLSLEGEDPRRIRLSREGLFLGNAVFREFVEPEEIHA